MNTVHDYLQMYNQDCWLVYRPMGEGWSNRVTYKSPDYDNKIPYNHRSILDNEVVFDFDAESFNENEKQAKILCGFLNSMSMSYTCWWSGNKGHHVHTFWDFKGVTNIPLMKRSIMEWLKPYGAEIDMQLTGSHLIRAEYGLNEKSGEFKQLLWRSNEYFLNIIPPIIWETCNEKARARVARVHNKGDVANHEAVKYFIQVHEFGKKKDGHERALWMLIQVLKHQWTDDKEGFIKSMQEWYRASGGKQLSDGDVKARVNYHWNRDYHITPQSFIELREDITAL